MIGTRNEQHRDEFMTLHHPHDVSRLFPVSLEWIVELDWIWIIASPCYRPQAKRPSVWFCRHDSPACWDLIKALVKVFSVDHFIAKDGRSVI